MGVIPDRAELQRRESELRAKMASELGHGEPPPGWVGGVAPATLLHLEAWLEKQLAAFREFPKTAQDYFHKEVTESPAVTYIRRTPRPRALAGRLGLAQATIDNAHRWLDSQSVSGKPDWPRSLPDVETADRCLSELRNFVGSLRNQYQADPVLEPIRDAIHAVLIAADDGHSRDHRDAVTLLTRALKKGRSICPQIVTAAWASEVASAAYAILTPDRDSAVRKLEDAKQHLWNATQFGVSASATLGSNEWTNEPLRHARNSPEIRGRRKRGGQPKYDPQDDAKKVERLKASGMSAKDFAAKNGIKFRELTAARDRVRKRKAKCGMNRVKSR